MTRSIRLIAAVFVLAAGAVVFAQKPTDIVKWTAKDGGRDVKAGASVSLELTAEVAPGWHLYALTQPKGGPNPLEIAVAKGSSFEIKAEAITAPAPEATNDDVFGLETRQYDGTVVFTVPISAGAAARSGKHSVPIQITFQACGNGICLRPFTQTLPIELVVSR
jgi:DsbC/DsbD-like thiol-disulfide interchange protein